MKKLLFLCLFLALFCSLSVSAKPLTQIKEFNIDQKKLSGKVSAGNYTARRYILGPNDVISLFFYNVPELNQKDIKIQPDGKINIGPVGFVDVNGLTLDELTKKLEERFAYYLKNPKLSITLQESRPFIAYVTGAVLNPGSYEISTETNKSYYQNSNKSEVYIERKTPLLTNILVAAGGVLFDADLENVVVKNDIDKSEYKVNLLNLLQNGKVAEDIYLVPGDNVYVPKLVTPLAIDENKYKLMLGSSFAQKTIPVKVYGYVNAPGLVKLDTAQSANLNSAITAAGGYLKDSAYAPKKVFISRADVSGKLVAREVNPMSNDVLLMPNDIIYVPEKTRPLVGKAFDYMARVFIPFNIFANAYNEWYLMFDPTRYRNTIR